MENVLPYSYMANENTNATGAAGVYRIISELLLRGHNPAIQAFDDGVDILLENGKKIQVKTAHQRERENGRKECYYFNITSMRYRKKKNYKIKRMVADYLIFYAIDHNAFLILPKEVLEKMAKTNFSIAIEPRTKRHSDLLQYKDKWEYLN